MKNILVLGAGLVSRPGVNYLLEHKDLSVTVASRTVSKAEKLVKGYANGKAVAIDVENEQALTTLIKEHDIVISLLPWIHHVKVATLCLEHVKDMVTTSYVSEGMKKLDKSVREKGLLFLNEIGVDPGIDHMSAMKIIHTVESEGGKVLHFFSYCGGLPAPEHNNNPFGYKFSWSPRGVVLASRNSARFLEDGKIVEIEGKNLFVDPLVEEIEGLGKFEVYPNRDSVPYQEMYGLKDALTVKRGTYRNLGWCATLKKIVDLGLVDETPQSNLKDVTFKKMTADLVGCPAEGNVREATAKKLGIAPDSEIIGRLEWLGLFSDEPVPAFDNRLDILSQRLQEKLFFKEGEKDMLILRHRFIVENKDQTHDLITSTLIDYGIPFGDSSMARTVSLPLAIATHLIAEGRMPLKGVQTPVHAEIYEPVLRELEALNIKMVEKRIPLK
ncbi:MAG: saccharopine dehydrogenase NADP-binding domain-containing protein [Candidatus Aminicenantes bacterium]|nr:saccharopine dehydrogenase NADP-binding domain-containing protein [Candidatus Aminicenantes bacterium]